MCNVTKVCSVCGIEKELSHFPTRKDKDRPNRYYRGICKECRRVKQREVMKQRRANNPKYKEKAKEYNKKYNKIATYRYQTDEEYRKEYRRKQREWAAKNKYKRYQYDRVRYIKKMGTPVEDQLTEEQWENIKADCNYTCSYCGASDVKLTQDHFIPISKGGLHTANNIVPSCVSCNSSKQARNPFEWMLSKGIPFSLEQSHNRF